MYFDNFPVEARYFSDMYLNGIVFTYLLVDSLKGHLCCWEGIIALPGFRFHSEFKMKLGSIMIKILDPRIFNMTIFHVLNTSSFLVLHSLTQH